MSICLLLLFKKKRMEEFSYLHVTNLRLYPAGILFLTYIFLGLENQKTKPLPFRTGFHWMSAKCCSNCYGVGHVIFPLVFSASIRSPLLHHSTCLCSKRQMCSDAWKNTKKQAIVLFLLSSFSLWQRLSVFTECEVLSRQTALPAALKA